MCLDLKSGKLLWDKRLPGGGPRTHSWSSVVLAGGRLYVPNQQSEVFVLKAAPEFEVLATNEIGDELMQASAALSDGQVFLRTHKALWCLGKERAPGHG